MRNIIKILFLFFTISLNAQVWNNVLVKTHILRDVIIFNPNIALEKIVSNKNFSIEIEYTYKYKDVGTYTCEPSFWRYYKTTGSRVLLGVKYFFGDKEKIPNSWYLFGQIGYDYIYKDDYIKCPLEINTYVVNTTKEYMEYNLVVGREFRVYKKIFMEINLGGGYLAGNYKQYNVTYNKFEINDKISKLYLYSNFTIGYFISKN